MKELPITMEHPDNWMEKTGGYAKDMTLRDYFAAKASEEDIQANREGPMQEQVITDGNGRKHITHQTVRYTREQAKYRYADAMLKARN
jgi:hypothetical protein